MFIRRIQIVNITGGSTLRDQAPILTFDSVREGISTVSSYNFSVGCSTLGPYMSTSIEINYGFGVQPLLARSQPFGLSDVFHFVLFILNESRVRGTYSALEHDETH